MVLDFGGRTLDGALPTAWALPRIAEAIDGAPDVAGIGGAIWPRHAEALRGQCDATGGRRRDGFTFARHVLN